jgi:hypothetical protein
MKLRIDSTGNVDDLKKNLLTPDVEYMESDAGDGDVDEQQLYKTN